MLAQVIVSKFADHQPVHRQEKIKDNAFRRAISHCHGLAGYLPKTHVVATSFHAHSDRD